MGTNIESRITSEQAKEAIYQSHLTLGDKADLTYVNNKYSGYKNILINGCFRINQRGATSKTATTNDYNYDRWYYNGTTLEQRIEEENYKTSTVYTLSGTNVTTAQLTSPSSGPWTVTVPITASNVQLEEGSVATPFEQRPYGLELSLCQRYYWRGGLDGANGNTGYYGNLNMTLLNVGSITFPVTMRVIPTMSVVTPPTYVNCMPSAIVAYSIDGASLRVNKDGTSGLYRAYNGVYEASAEL